jgi:hypothetical protein
VIFRSELLTSERSRLPVVIADCAASSTVTIPATGRRNHQCSKAAWLDDLGGFDVTPARIERATYSLEGCCSIQLSYGVGRETNYLIGVRSNYFPTDSTSVHFLQWIRNDQRSQRCSPENANQLRVNIQKETVGGKSGYMYESAPEASERLYEIFEET